jgi:APA family basic amino acid/polyamine antiporter
VILFGGVAVAALFVLRHREPDAPRPFKALGYPLAPAIFTIVSAAIVFNALWTDLFTPLATGTPWGPAAAGILVIGLGLPVYYLLRLRRG